MKEITLKKTKRVNTVLALQKDGNRQISAYSEVLYTDTGSPRTFLFSAKISWKQDEKIPENIVIEVRPCHK